MNYFDELKKSMEWLAKKSDTYFIGQSVLAGGTAMYGTLKDIDPDKRLELFVGEEFQMGASIGLALEGYVPISVFPRWNFLLTCVSGLVNHLDKYPLISDYRPKVIIRTGIGSSIPLDPSWMHKGDFTEAFKLMCKTINVVRLDKPEDIFPTYQKAYESEYSSLIIEVSDFLSEEFRQNYEKFKLTCPL